MMSIHLCLLLQTFPIGKRVVGESNPYKAPAYLAKKLGFLLADNPHEEQAAFDRPQWRVATVFPLELWELLTQLKSEYCCEIELSAHIVVLLLQTFPIGKKQSRNRTLMFTRSA